MTSSSEVMSASGGACHKAPSTGADLKFLGGTKTDGTF